MEWNKDRIKSLRKRLGWTQQQLADKLGVSKRAVRYWEKGKRAPSSEILPKLDNLASPTSEGNSKKGNKGNKRNSLKRNSLKRNSLKRNSLKRNSLKRNSLKRNSQKR